MPMLDETAVRDRYQQFAGTARALLADFREVEENFRKLDRQLREKIAGWHGGKGELLDDVLGSRESIAGSDQGRSFQAFYGFLLSQARQEELSEPAGPGARAYRHRRARHPAAAHPLRLAGCRRAHPGDGPPALRAAPAVPRRPGVVREPPGDRHPAQHRNAVRCSSARPGTSPVTMELDAFSPAIRLPLERPLYAPVERRASTATRCGTPTRKPTRRLCSSRSTWIPSRCAAPSARPCAASRRSA